MSKVRPFAAAASLPILLLSLAGCDIVTADFKARESTDWKRSYALAPNGRIEIVNVNGSITVGRSDDGNVQVHAVKSARGPNQDAARQVLERIEIVETASPSEIKLETRSPRIAPAGGGAEVRYTIKVPASAEARLTTVNGAIEIAGLDGRVSAQTTNGGIRARGIGGSIQATTTNGGVDVELTRVAEPGVQLQCTNGGIELQLPADAKATISARVTNGGIDTDGLSLESAESSRRRLRARLNGGGPPISIEGTNGGIRMAGR